MNHLSNLKKLETAEIRQYLKQNQEDETLIHELIQAKDEFVPFLLAHKFMPDSFISKLSKDCGLNFVLDNFIQYGFTPSLSFIESLISSGDSADASVLKALTAFPSLPITVQILIRLINDGFIESACFLTINRIEFQKTDILLLLAKAGTSNPLLINFCLDNQDVIEIIIDNLNNKSTFFSNELINEVLIQCDLSDLNTRIIIESYLGLSSGAYTAVLNKGLPPNSGYSRYSTRNTYEYLFQWSEALERVDKDLIDSAKIVLKDAPPNSKFRLNFIYEDPEAAEDSELLTIINDKENRLKLTSILKEVLRRDLTLIKEVPAELFEQFLTPVKLVESIANKKTEKAIYLLGVLSSKYNSVLRKCLSINEVPQKHNLRKKSYFSEIFQALKDNDITEFRLALSHGYSIEQFAEDSVQSSKKRSCELTNVSDEMLTQLKKDELLVLCLTPLRLSRYGDNKFEFTFSVSESLILLKKFDVTTCFDFCDDKCKFLADKNLDSENVSALFSSRKEIIMGDPSLLRVYLKLTKNRKDMSFDYDSIFALSKILTTKELREFITADNYVLRACLSIRGKDNEFFVTKAQIFELIDDRYNLESDEFLSALVERDRDLAKEVVEAYLSGNKALSLLTGRKINLKRMAIDKFNLHHNALTKDIKSIVDDIFARGGRWEDFKKEIVDPAAALNKYHDGRTVFLEQIGIENIKQLNINEHVKVFAKSVSFGSNYYSPRTHGDCEIPLNFKFNKFVIALSALSDERITFLAEIQKMYPDVIFTLTDNVYFNSRLELARRGITTENSTEWLRGIISARSIEVDSLKIEQIKFLDMNGLIVDVAFTKQLIKAKSDCPDIISWLVSRVGSFENETISDEDFAKADEEVKVIFSKAGLNVVSRSELKLRHIEATLENEGANFNPINVSNFSLKEKTRIIRFIESKIDQNYVKLNLLSSNLASLEVITSYESMREFHEFEDKDLVILFNIPKTVSDNKKIMKGVRDLLAVRGWRLAQKVISLKKAIASINPTVEVILSDLLDYSNQSDVIETESFLAIQAAQLIHFANLNQDVSASVRVLKNKTKPEILRFLRSVSGKEDNYIEDTVEFIGAVLRGIDALKERVDFLKTEPDSDEQITIISDSIQSIMTRLEEVSAMDDIEHMHDRLVPLLSFIKSDPTQPLGQDKFGKLEGSKKLSNNLGYNLYFPKTRGDLQFLGDNNGWCVNNSASYGDNVIQKGNILVGICEKDTSAKKENVIALAHYLNNNGRYHLEQLKWSNRIKGTNNVDATKDFSHSSILGEITEFLGKYKK